MNQRRYLITLESCNFSDTWV